MSKLAVNSIKSYFSDSAKTYIFPSVRAKYQDALSEARIPIIPIIIAGVCESSELARNLHQVGREIEYWPFVCACACPSSCSQILSSHT